ncbi:cell cycle checkpoint control protein RAD9A isoform X6 [Macaca thibetana thibetana]|uniref:cell cycle checkpoint control protein RAD9A isoform X11 n=1 Tax=Macaca mulatta TaxID=9544 RepID=UPI0010A22CEB|nr:cell cycle checkpoint control protein RAD9A isoform X11 [Macaca mulatta]XP_050612698.1 cell cycle checkpoint control protein RAD9A isoform X6 [Macaca thibetana thibetana]
MKCLVTGGNVKVLGKAVHSLSRIGDELYLEPLEDGLSLRTVNSSRSAYACFLFAPLFFQQYQAATPGQDLLRCKILMKSFLSVFRSLAMLEKTVEKCCISLNGRSSRLVVQLHCKFDSTAKAMVTEMCLGEEDFQQLQAQEGVAITFCLKEFRGLLSFAESANLNLSIHFDAPGRPAIFTIKDSLLDGHFVLATLSDTDSHSQDLGSPERHQPVPQLQAHSIPHPDDFANDDIDSYMIAMETTIGNEGSRVLPSISLSPGPQHPESPGLHSEEDEAEPSTVPGTPPPKKFRSLFFGSILAPVRSPQGPSPVLAEDSEGEG